MTDFSDRHPATQHLLSLFAYEHLPPMLQTTSRYCFELAHQMVIDLPDGPELSFGLRQLLLAKDAFVRCAVEKMATGV